ncbi:hypothetical protein BDN70DRAFT_900402 [Pholiota conissans]|uniref:Uncharacterized protein n=1 Tax=Pholiota conissans TaxID=109636 RepID=A0A9P5YNN0_9AGAR|nr:hypothetical protein BDN70DRAFT_900402 [Pholiota conissans]
MDSKLIAYHEEISQGEGYVGAEDFPLKTTWMAEVNGESLFDLMGSSNLICTIVGVVSPAGLKMAPHGNFDPFDLGATDDPIKRLNNAAMEFRLTRPTDQFKIFQEEFDQAIQNLHLLSDDSSTASAHTTKLISYDHDEGPLLLFSKFIFCAHYAPKLSFITDAEQYPVAENIRPFLVPMYGKYKATPIRATHLNNPMHAPINAQYLQTDIEGALVEVRFLLNRDRYAKEGLSANIYDVCILKQRS